MARPQKTGLDYFYFSCDFFDNRKVRKILKGCGLQGITILSYLLCNIYKNGYYIMWEDDESTFDISDKLGVSDGAVSELVKKAIDADFFSAKMFKDHKILTSPAIQEIYFDACKRRDVIKYDDRYLLIDIKEYKKTVNVNINSVNVGGSTQSKGEKSREEESKGEAPAPAELVGLTSEKLQQIAAAVWTDQGYRETLCMGLSIDQNELRGWMALFNASLTGDSLADFTDRSYKKMLRGWIAKQQAKGYKPGAATAAGNNTNYLTQRKQDEQRTRRLEEQ